MTLLKMTGTEFKAKIYRSIISFFGKLPLNALYKVGNFAAWGMRSVVSYRKNVIYTNLARSFPEKKYEEILAEKGADECAAIIVDLPGGTPFNAAMRIIAELCRRLLPELWQPPSLPRYWELLGGIYEYSYTIDLTEHIDKNNFYVAYRAMYNKVSDKVFYENRRAPLPDYTGQVEDVKMLRHAVARKDNKPIYVLIADQFPYKACHPVGTFLNQPTVGMLGGFALAVKLGFAVLYMRQERAGRGHYKLTYEVITENAAGQDPEELMRKYFAMLEADIRKDPANWLWSHKRWK